MSSIKYKAAFYTLGCRVNQYETDSMIKAFQEEGFEIGSFSEPCDVYIINTCTVTGESDRKSRQIIRRACQTGGKSAVVMAVGCFTQINPDEASKIEGLDYIGGNKNKGLLAKKARELIDKKNLDLSSSKDLLTNKSFRSQIEVTDIAAEKIFEKMSIDKTDKARAFVKIVDGCENNCSYCIIPKARGPVRSKPVEDVLNELLLLSQNNYNEVVLTGIETAEYGKDLGTDLVSLLERVSEIQGISRIRLGSLEPTFFSKDNIKRLSILPKIMPHFHISLQSGCDKVLHKMRRKYNTGQFYEKLCLLRQSIPDITFTTDIITGFPGETEQDFKQTLDFAEKCNFLHVHIFPFSVRKDTDAALMQGKVSQKDKKQRSALLKEKMLLSRKNELQHFCGKSMQILVEKSIDGEISGHTPNYIECRVPIKQSDNIKTTLEKGIVQGQLINVKLCSVSDNLEYILGSIL